MNDSDEHDIDALHRAVLRERQEPTEGREPVPAWMIVGFAALVGWGGWYLGRYDARFDLGRADMHAPAGAEAAVAAPAAGPDLAAVGAQVYASRCSACHQATGQGMAGVAPPLAGSEWVTGDERRLARIVLHGLSGPVEVKGQAWNGAMPAWGGALTDDEVAGVLTHLRGAWGNAAAPVRAATVAEVRAADARSTPWTAPEL